MVITLIDSAELPWIGHSLGVTKALIAYEDGALSSRQTGRRAE